MLAHKYVHIHTCPNIRRHTCTWKDIKIKVTLHYSHHGDYTTALEYRNGGCCWDSLTWLHWLSLPLPGLSVQDTRNSPGRFWSWGSSPVHGSAPCSNLTMASGFRIQCPVSRKEFRTFAKLIIQVFWKNDSIQFKEQVSKGTNMNLLLKKGDMILDWNHMPKQHWSHKCLHIYWTETTCSWESL